MEYGSESATLKSRIYTKGTVLFHPFHSKDVLPSHIGTTETDSVGLRGCKDEEVQTVGTFALSFFSSVMLRPAVFPLGLRLDISPCQGANCQGRSCLPLTDVLFVQGGSYHKRDIRDIDLRQIFPEVGAMVCLKFYLYIGECKKGALENNCIMYSHIFDVPVVPHAGRRRNTLLRCSHFS